MVSTNADEATRIDHPNETVAHSGREPSALALPRGDVLGRYVVLEVLGRGGMGIVYAAYDPVLDRKVAIKLVRAAGSSRGATEARARLLREAQALAKLAHPNVVAVHDAGVVERETSLVFVAMEVVVGCTLATWREQTRRSWREILPVVLAAGRGLEAVHAAGLVHRDVKPQNVMIGDDGRVRLMDFGLVRATGLDSSDDDAAPTTDAGRTGSTADGPQATLTEIGTVLGTPAYMALEQHLGLPADARSDQFGFAAMLWEALYRERPYAGRDLAELRAAVRRGVPRAVPRDSGVPSHIHRALVRALAASPDARFTSMGALIAALERDPARARRVWLGLGGLAVAAMALVGWRGWDAAQTRAACEREGAAITEAWNEDVRERTSAALLATDVPYAATTAERLVPWLDDYASRWSAMREWVCAATRVEHTRSPELAAESNACLDERRDGFAALLEILTRRQDPDTVRTAVHSAAALPPLEPCIDDAWLARAPDPPADETRERLNALRAALVALRIRHAASATDDDLPRAEELHREAESIGWAPAIAEATLAVSAMSAASDPDASEAMLRRGFEIAVFSGHDLLAIDAAIALSQRPAHNTAHRFAARTWHTIAGALIDRVGARDTIREANLLNATGIMNLGEDIDQAHADLRRSIEIRERILGDAHPSIAGSYNNLAHTFEARGDLAGAARSYERAIEIVQSALGDDHPDLAAMLSNFASLRQRQGDLDEALRLLRRSLAIAEASLGAGSPDAAIMLDQLADLQADRGQFDEAIALARRAQAVAKATRGRLGGPAPLLTLASIHHRRGRADDEAEALRLHAQAVDELVSTSGTSAHRLLEALTSWAELELELAQPAAARNHAERAVEIAASISPGAAARSRFVLARALTSSGGDLGEAVQLAELARDAYRDSGRAPERLAEIEAWLKAQSSTPRTAPSPGE